MWCFALVYLFLGKAAAVALSEGRLKESIHGSVCSKVVSETITRYESYTETYRRTWGPFYQTKWRTNWRIAPRDVYRLTEFCCENFVEVNDICLPTCHPPCGHGRCIDLDKCECLPGYEQSREYGVPISHDEECQPICPDGCGSGKCTEPSICTCDHGYFFENGTCHPLCSDCPTEHNAYCAAPADCECLMGYNWTSHESELNRRVCSPVCEIPCTNGVCTEPNTCTCNPGYKHDDYDRFRCFPVCEDGCRFGSCVAPNTCACNRGFTMKEGSSSSCVPFCKNECVHGECILPDTCVCNEGFAFIYGSWFECEPVCEKLCGNGTCTSPGECVCHEGYRISTNEDGPHVCEPHCKIPCGPYGTCTAPDTCTCPEGFRLVDPTVNRNKSIYFEFNTVCEPVCSNNCENGYCIAPDFCACNPGFLKVTDECKPSCSQNCVAGYCSAPNTCTCNAGYKPVSAGSDICTPVCNQTCVNGFCTRPDTCTCNPGYEPASKDSNDTCNPICKACGPNAVCTAPELCTCNEGYAKDESGECKPFCESCANGTCVDPGVCQCDEGFVLWTDIVSNFSSCRPLCPDCSHKENCSAAEDCVCQDGYVKRKEEANAEDSSICVKLCEDDCNLHGTCTENATCQCFNGWQGDRCDQSIFCRIEIDSTNWTISDTLENNKTFLEALNAAELCPSGCRRTISNSSECTALLDRNATENGIACLIEKGFECQASFGISTGSPNIAKTAGIAAGSTLILLLLVTAVYLMIRKRRNGRLSLGTVPSGSTQRRPTLLPEDENDDQDEDL